MSKDDLLFFIQALELYLQDKNISPVKRWAAHSMLLFHKDIYNKCFK